jgi:hypothetical protein
METQEAIYELHCFAAVGKIFPLRELQDFADPSLDLLALHESLISDRRFIRTSDDRSGEDLFILDSILFQWLIKLNMRLSRIAKFKLSKKQVTFLFSMLRGTARFEHPPAAFIAWGQKMGLICECWSGDHYVFPLATILSAMSERATRALMGIINDLKENQVWNLDLNKRVKECIESGLSLFDPSIKLIITRREALTGRRIWTLQRLGDSFGLTRERIRQLEDKFWVSINYGYRTFPTFLEAFLCDYMCGAGSLIIDRKSTRAPLRIFLAKCAGIALSDFPKLGLISMASKSEENALMRSQEGINLILDRKMLADRLDSSIGVNYSGEDIRTVSERIIRYNRKRLTGLQRVYLALASISKPAHYSKVTSVYNVMWPNHVADENTVHVTLARQKMGIVWIGLNGVYALNKWGYERPSKTLFSTVAEIVKSKYQEIGKPVNINLIAAELGKHRKLVRSQSLDFALMCNPLIKRVSKDMYVPSEHNEEIRNELGLERIDKLLENFKINKNRNS